MPVVYVEFMLRQMEQMVVVKKYPVPDPDPGSGVQGSRAS